MRSVSILAPIPRSLVYGCNGYAAGNSYDRSVPNSRVTADLKQKHNPQIQTFVDISLFSFLAQIGTLRQTSHSNQLLFAVVAVRSHIYRFAGTHRNHAFETR